MCFLLGVARSEVIGSDSWLKEDERSVSDDNEDDDDDDCKPLPADCYAYYSKNFMYFYSLIFTVTL